MPGPRPARATMLRRGSFFLQRCFQTKSPALGSGANQIGGAEVNPVSLWDKLGANFYDGVRPLAVPPPQVWPAAHRSASEAARLRGTEYGFVGIILHEAP